MNPQERVFFAGTRQVVPLLERLAPAAAAGFTAVTAWPGDVVHADRGAIREAVAAQGLKITDMECIGNWLPGHATAQGGWADAVRAATPEKIIGLAAELGAGSVSVVELMGMEWDPAAQAGAFAAICDRAAEHGMTVAIENVPVGAVSSFARALELVERAERGNAGIMVDSWHFFRSGSLLDDLARCPSELILSIQLNDALATPEADLNSGMMRRLLPGEGELDLRGFMQALAATGTQAPIGIETFSAELDALDTMSAMQRCAMALDLCLRMAK
jgi:sugar phosphate isomerase/epimerase